MKATNLIHGVTSQTDTRLCEKARSYRFQNRCSPSLTDIATNKDECYVDRYFEMYYYSRPKIDRIYDVPDGTVEW